MFYILPVTMYNTMQLVSQIKKNFANHTIKKIEKENILNAPKENGI